MNCFFRQNRNVTKQALILYIDEYKNQKKNLNRKLFVNFRECVEFKNILEERFGFEVKTLKNSLVEKHHIMRYLNSEVNENCNYLLFVFSVDLFLEPSLPSYVKCYSYDEKSRYLDNFLMSTFHRFRINQKCQYLFITNHCRMSTLLEYCSVGSMMSNVLTINERSYTFGRLVTEEFRNREFYLEDLNQFCAKQYPSMNSHVSTLLKKQVFVKRAKLFNVPGPQLQRKRVFLFHEEKMNNIVRELTQNNHKILIQIQGKLGSGKSYLATQIAHRDEVRSFFVDGIYWVDLEGGPNDDLGLQIIQKRLLKLMNCTKKVNINNPAMGLKVLKKFIRKNYFRNILIILDEIGREGLRFVRYLDVSMKSESKAIKILVTGEHVDEKWVPYKSVVHLRTPNEDVFKKYFQRRFRHSKNPMEYREDILVHFQTGITNFLLYCNGVMSSKDSEGGEHAGVLDGAISEEQKKRRRQRMAQVRSTNVLKATLSLFSLDTEINLDELFRLNKDLREEEEEDAEYDEDGDRSEESKTLLVEKIRLRNRSRRRKTMMLDLILKEMSPSLKNNFLKLVIFPTHRIPVKLVSVLWDSSSINECMFYLKRLHRRHAVDFYGKDEIYVHPIVMNLLKAKISKKGQFEFSLDYVKRLSFLCRGSGVTSSFENFTERVNWHEFQIKEFSQVEGSKGRVLNYYFTHLFYHLNRTKSYITMEKSLLHYGWIEKKLQRTGDINLVLSDYSYLAKNLKAFKIVFEVLKNTQLTKHVMTSLSSQIMSSLRNFDHIELIRQYVENILQYEIKKGKNFLFPYLKNFSGVDLFKSSIILRLPENMPVGPILMTGKRNVFIYGMLDGHLVHFDMNKKSELQRIKTLDAPSDRITSIAVSKKIRMKIVVIGTDFGMIKGMLLEDFETSFLLQAIPGPDYKGGQYRVEDLAFINFDTEVLACCNDKTLKIYNLMQKRITHRIDLKDVTLESVHSLFVSPNEYYFMTVSKRFVRIFSTGVHFRRKKADFTEDEENEEEEGEGGSFLNEEGKGLERLFKLRSCVCCVDRNFRYIYAGTLDGDISKYDVHNGMKIFTFSTVHDGAVSCMKLSYDGKHLFSGSNDRRIKMYETDTGSEICQFLGHKGIVMHLEVTKDFKFLISGSLDNSVILWDIQHHMINMEQGEAQVVDNHAGQVCDLSIDMEKKLVWTAAKVDTFIKVWGVENGNFVKSLELDDIGCIKGIGEHYICVYSPNRRSLRIFDKFNHFRKLYELTDFRSDIRMMTVIDGEVSKKSKISKYFRRMSRRKRVKYIEASQDRFLANNLTYSAFFVCISKNVCYTYDIELDSFYRGCYHEYTVICASGLHETLATGTVEGIVRLWNFKSGEMIKMIKLKDKQSPTAITLSKHNRLVFIGTEGGTVEVWDMTIGKGVEDVILLSKFGGKSKDQPITSIRLGRDCFFTCGGVRLRVWRWRRGNENLHDVVEQVVKERISCMKVVKGINFDLVVCGCEDGSLIFLKHIVALNSALSMLRRSRSQGELKKLEDPKE